MLQLSEFKNYSYCFFVCWIEASYGHSYIHPFMMIPRLLYSISVLVFELFALAVNTKIINEIFGKSKGFS